MDVQAIKEALAAAGRAIPGLTCLAYEPDAVTAPLFAVAETDVTYDQAFRGGMHILTVTCRLYVSGADDRAGQAAATAYMATSGIQSIKAALEAARGAPGQYALGGAADDLHVTRIVGPRRYPVGSETFYGIEITLRVIGSGAL
jgi:hypothetical protein